MTIFKVVGAALLLSAVSATSALAQAAIQEPGAFAFYHPDGDPNLGSPRPPADAMAQYRRGVDADRSVNATPRRIPHAHSGSAR